MLNSPSLTDNSLPHVVIVGAGFAGLECAKALRTARARVTLIDRSNHHLFQPLLYQVATAGLSPGDIASPIRVLMRRNRNTEVVMGEVVDVDPTTQLVTLQNGHTITFDYLMLATGSTHSYFGNEHWERFAPGLKTVTDATTIRKKILLAYESAELETDAEKRRALLTFVIVGGGPTGVELAGSLSEMAKLAMQNDFRHIDPKNTRILLIEASPRILGQFPEELAQAARQELERLGVEVMLGKRVEEIDQSGVMVSGERLDAKTVIWAAGVKASPAGTWLKAETDRAGRVVVGGDLSVQGHPNIFVLGDTAHALDEAGKPLPGVAPVAMQQGKYVGRLLRERLAGRAMHEQFHYKDKGSMATVGRAFAIAMVKKLRLKGFLAWLTWIFVHIMYLVEFRNRVIVLLQWIWAYVTYQRGVRLIVGEEEPEPVYTPPREAV